MYSIYKRFLNNIKGEITSGLLVVGMSVLAAAAIIAPDFISQKNQPSIQYRNPVTTKIPPKDSGVINKGNIIGLCDHGTAWYREDVEKYVSNPDLIISLETADKDILTECFGKILKGNSVWKVENKDNELTTKYQPDCLNVTVQIY